MKRLVISLAFALIGAGAVFAQTIPATSVTGYLYERIHRIVLESVTDSVVGRPVKNLDPYYRRHQGQMNNISEVTGALARDFTSYRQPRLKVLTKAQADAWAARLEAGYIGIGASFDAVGFSDGLFRVSSVDVDTKAEDAGIKAGDRIAAINGKSMKNLSLSEVRSLLQGEVGSVLAISILRNGAAKDISVEVDMDGRIGVEVDFDENSLKRYFKTGKLSEDSPAFKGGLRENDLVVSFNGQAVQTLPTADFINLVRNGPMGDTLTFDVLRDQKPLKVEVVRGIVAAADWDAYKLSRQSGGYPDDFESNHFEFKLNNLDWVDAVKMTDNAVQFIDDAPGGFLDLRGSSGNDLDAAVLIAARFLNDGRIIRFKLMQGQMPVEVTYSLERFTVVKTMKGSLSTTTANGQIITTSVDSQVEIGTVTKKYYQGKLVVLTDGQTSGTSELLAAILQKHNRASVVGRKSAGISTLVSVRTIEGVTVQIPTTKIVEFEGQPFKRVQPDVSSWIPSGDREAALNALAGRPWYMSNNIIVLATTLAILVPMLGFVFWFARRPEKAPVEPEQDADTELPSEEAEAEPNSAPQSKGARWTAFLPLLMVGVLLGSLYLLPKIVLGPPSGVTSKIVVELITDSSDLSKRQQKVVNQLASEYSGAIEFKLLKFSDGPDVLEKSSDGFWKAGVHELHPATIWIRRIYLDRNGKPIPGKFSGSGMGTFTKAWLVRSIEHLSGGQDYWPATAITRTKPAHD